MQIIFEPAERPPASESFGGAQAEKGRPKAMRVGFRGWLKMEAQSSPAP
jgi:hypothetical protein